MSFHEYEDALGHRGNFTANLHLARTPPTAAARLLPRNITRCSAAAGPADTRPRLRRPEWCDLCQVEN